MPETLTVAQMEALLIYAAAKLEQAEAGLSIQVRRLDTRGARNYLLDKPDIEECVQEATQLMVRPSTDAEQLLRFAAGVMFTPQEKLVIAALADGTAKADDIARKLGHDEAGSDFRRRLADMVERGLLVSNKQGYRVTDARIFLLATMT